MMSITKCETMTCVVTLLPNYTGDIIAGALLLGMGLTVLWFLYIQIRDFKRWINNEFDKDFK
jgi:hypothetical protein